MEVASFLNKSQKIQASTPGLSIPATHPVHCSLLQLEQVIDTKKYLYMNGLIEDCNLRDSSFYNV